MDGGRGLCAELTTTIGEYPRGRGTLRNMILSQPTVKRVLVTRTVTRPSVTVCSVSACSSAAYPSLLSLSGYRVLVDGSMLVYPEVYRGAYTGVYIGRLYHLGT